MPVKVTGPDGKTYQFPDGTDKAAAIAYFKKKNIGVPGFTARLGEATGFPTSMEQLKQAQPTTAEKIGGPAVTAGKMAVNYGKGLVSGAREATEGTRNPIGYFLENLPSAGQPFNPLNKFLLKNVAGPLGTGGIANLGEDIPAGNYSGAAGDVLGTLINALMLRKSLTKSPTKATNQLTAAAGRDMLAPIERTLPELRTSAADIGKPSSMQGFYEVTDNASRQITREAEAALAPIANRQVLPRTIAQKIRDLITSDMQKTPEGRAEIQYINSQARQFEQPWTFGQLDSKRMRLNAELNTFQKKGEGARYTAKKGNINVAIDNTIANSIRDIVYPQMDAAAGRPQGYFRSLKQKQGNLMELSAELDPRNRKGRTMELRQRTAEAQGASRFSRENMSIHMGGSGVPRASLYGLLNVIKKPNPLATANKLVGKGFSTGSPTAKAYTGTLPMRSTLFPAPEEQR